MWKKEQSVVAEGVTAEQIWKVWSDINNWPRYDAGLEWVKADQGFQFAPSNWFYLKPKGGPKVKIIITEVTPNKSFTDYTVFPLAKMYDVHELTSTAEGIKITHITSVTGPLGWLWRKLVAEKVANDIPAQTQNLIAMAKTK
ncbi:MAG: polyketide cyclase [Gammaproteobacteria bacterium]|nr:polyketide cyclase [Gammaproteobacteria bacterium]